MSDKDINIALVGPVGAGKTVFSAVIRECTGLAISSNKDTKKRAKVLLDNIKNGKWPEPTVDDEPIKLKYELKGFSISFSDYKGEKIKEKGYISNIVGTPDYIILLFNVSYATEKQNCCRDRAEEILNLLKALPATGVKPYAVAIVVTANDLLSSLSEEQKKNFDDNLADIENTVKGHYKSETFPISVTGKLDDPEKPKLDRNEYQKITKIFEWILETDAARERRETVKPILKKCLWAAAVIFLAAGLFLGGAYWKGSDAVSRLEGEMKEKLKETDHINKVKQLFDVREQQCIIKNKHFDHEKHKRLVKCDEKCWKEYGLCLLLFPCLKDRYERTLSELEEEIDEASFRMFVKEKDSKAFSPVSFKEWSPLTAYGIGKKDSLKNDYYPALAEYAANKIYEGSDDPKENYESWIEAKKYLETEEYRKTKGCLGPDELTKLQIKVDAGIQQYFEKKIGDLREDTLSDFIGEMKKDRTGGSYPSDDVMTKLKQPLQSKISEIITKKIDGFKKSRPDSLKMPERAEINEWWVKISIAFNGFSDFSEKEVSFFETRLKDGLDKAQEEFAKDIIKEFPINKSFKGTAVERIKRWGSWLDGNDDHKELRNKRYAKLMRDLDREQLSAVAEYIKELSEYNKFDDLETISKVIIDNEKSIPALRNSKLSTFAHDYLLWKKEYKANIQARVWIINQGKENDIHITGGKWIYSGKEYPIQGTPKEKKKNGEFVEKSFKLNILYKELTDCKLVISVKEYNWRKDEETGIYEFNPAKNIGGKKIVKEQDIIKKENIKIKIVFSTEASVFKAYDQRINDVREFPVGYADFFEALFRKAPEKVETGFMIGEVEK